MYTPLSVPTAHISRPGGCWNTVEQFTPVLQMGTGLDPDPGYFSSTDLIARSSGVPSIVTLLEPDVLSEFANAVSANTRRRKGSAF